MLYMEALFDRAYAAKKAALVHGKNTHPVWDRLVFSKIAEKVGLDKVRVMITGSAPIADHVLDFLRIVFACPVFEGYGLSETTGAGTVTADGDLAPGTVGAVLSCNELRLKDVPDMGYLRTDQVHKAGEREIPCHGRGEICFKGTNVFKGYYKMPDKTAEAIDEDGWFHSGDIGMWLPDGRLKIIDRKKNIFKLAQGEYVAPEKIEGLNVQSHFVAQSFVYGDSLKTQLVAIVVPDADTAASWAKQREPQRCCHSDSSRWSLVAMTACGIKEAATLLGVSCRAGRAEVESAFRRRALRCHPDRHPKDPLAKVRFLRLSKAKEVLLQALKDPQHPNVQRPSAGASAASHARDRTERAQREEKARGKREGEASEAMAKEAREREKREKARERREKEAKAARAAQAAELKRREGEAKLKKEKEQKEKEEAAKRRAAAMAEEMRRERMATAERRGGEIFEAFRKRKASKTSQETASQQQNQAQRSSPQAGAARIQHDPGFQLSDRHRKALQRLEKQRQGETPRTTGSWWVVDSEVDRFLKREALQGYVP
eukprot:s860_g18.t1